MLIRDVLINIGLILVLELLQVYVFNHIQLLNRYTPLIFLMYIIFLPARMSFNRVLILCFLLGLSLDLLIGTPGINAFCCTLTVLLREIFLHRIFSKSDDSFLELKDLNSAQIFVYILSISLFYNVLLYGMESFNFNNFLYNAKEGLINGLVTFVGISLFFLIFKNRLLK